MVDLVAQYERIQSEIDQELKAVMAGAQFIQGPKVKAFEQHMAQYLGVSHVVGCANGTDALQIAMMALGLQAGDEVIVPSFTYVATAEVIALLGLSPVMVDVDPRTFNITAELIAPAITERTRAVVPVHLFGQSADMAPILELAKQHNLFVVEDNAQALSAVYTFPDGTQARTGTMGHIGCTSFFPSKNLGCYGDGGAMFTNDDELDARLRMIANHGQAKKYHHSVVGINSRLDAMQAAILDVKLKYLDDYSQARQHVAARYDAAFADTKGLRIPTRQPNSTHVFHQYTLIVEDGKRDALRDYLNERQVPSMIYYPIPLYRQEAFKHYFAGREPLPVTEFMCASVLSLPIHTEMQDEVQDYIIQQVKDFFA